MLHRKLVNVAALACLVLTGCADAASSDSAAEGADALALAADDSDRTVYADAIDMTGTWYTRVKTKANITAPIVGASVSDIDLALKLLVRQDGANLTADVSMCALNTKSDSLTLDLSKTLQYVKLTKSVPAFTPVIGGKVPLPDVTFYIGQDEKGTAVDLDKDGKPGATQAVTALGLVPFDAYAGVKLAITMDATLSDAETVTGTATFAGEGTIFGSTFPLVTSGKITVAQAQTPTNFSAKHYAGDVACKDLLAKP